ncbi:restriction endonuclease PLD domain-containing protein [Pedobacter metabolipauper]|uniref:NgoFVII restriction endonuclease n=1 Tax=Pedobacter metabolipauper TaxID=425513 RepID=A0A4R6T059_9SPHI|nr:restriction endonuclease PLD domain-containing protein [Pedobacter metabolipauper]TDQ11399.1 NgoFVII restriction endonuclease [Pedobacter metabolipauper]
MELLLSNFSPAKLEKRSFKDFFSIQLSECNLLRIASGYISAESLVDLKNVIEINGGPKVELMIGMHYFDGFTKGQLNAAIELNDFLLKSSMGFVSVSIASKFHGKMYSFIKFDNTINSVIGSSNLGSILNSIEKLYEADLLVSGKLAEDINTRIIDLTKKLAVNIDDLNNFKIIEENDLLSGNEGVERVSKAELLTILNNLLELSFDIPVKSEPKSNMNVFFGKGRKSPLNGYIMPRSWYEVEIIVSKSITSVSKYPINQEFYVVTDDGWKFKCKTSGTFSKNFRSSNDLKILGKWIKGRLENSGALKVGERVDSEILKKYGRDYITLTATSIPEVWFLDYKS